MKSKQVLSIEQMKHLQELGLDTSDASMYWKGYHMEAVLMINQKVNGFEFTEGVSDLRVYIV